MSPTGRRAKRDQSPPGRPAVLLRGEDQGAATTSAIAEAAKSRSGPLRGLRQRPHRVRRQAQLPIHPLPIHRLHRHLLRAPRVTGLQRLAMILDWVWVLRRQISVRPKNRARPKFAGLLSREGRSMTRPPVQRAPDLHRLQIEANSDRVLANAAQTRALRSRQMANFLGNGAAGDAAVRMAATASLGRQRGPQPPLRLQRPTTNMTTPLVPNRTLPPMSPRRLSPILEKKRLEKSPRRKSKAVGRLALVPGGPVLTVRGLTVRGPKAKARGLKEHGPREHGPREHDTRELVLRQLGDVPMLPVPMSAVPMSPVRKTAWTTDQRSSKKNPSWSAGESGNPQARTTAKTMQPKKPSATKTFRLGKRPFRTCCIPIRCRSNPGLGTAPHPRVERLLTTNLVKPVT